MLSTALNICYLLPGGCCNDLILLAHGPICTKKELCLACKTLTCYMVRDGEIILLKARVIVVSNFSCKKGGAPVNGHSSFCKLDSGSILW